MKHMDTGHNIIEQQVEERVLVVGPVNAENPTGIWELWEVGYACGPGKETL